MRTRLSTDDMKADSPCLRFSFSENLPGGLYVACSLDEGRLRCWRRNEVSEGYYRLFFGTREERGTLYRILERLECDEDCVGFDLTEDELAKLRSLLGEDALDDAARYAGGSPDVFGVDLWGLTFYAELGNGLPPVKVEDVVAWTQCELAVFNELYPWIIAHFGLWQWGYSGGWNWNRKRSNEADRKLVQCALDDGMDAVESLLFDGKPSQIRLIDELEHKMPLSYRYGGDCFTLQMGRCVMRACKLVGEPNCVNVLGGEHEFKCRSNAKQD